MLSGGFAGLAGAAMLAGGGFAFGNYQLVPGFATNIGWTGLLVALVAREKALVAIPVAFIFAGLRTGSSFVGATGVEGRITDVIQGFWSLRCLSHQLSCSFEIDGGHVLQQRIGHSDVRILRGSHRHLYE